jgi:hypothetical protein
MKSDSWTLPLDPARPQAVWEKVDMFGHIFVLAAPVNARLLSDAGIKAMARWAGIVRRKTASEVSGIGMVGWLGDDTNKGFNFSPTNNATFATWVSYILGGAVTAGNVTAVGAGLLNWTPVGGHIDQRQALDFVCSYFSSLGLGTAEYRVNPDATLDAGLTTALWVTTPKVVLLDGEGGRDLNLTGIPCTLTVSRDVEDYATGIVVKGNTLYGSDTISPATTYKDLHGNLISITNVVSAPLSSGQEVPYATALKVLTDHVRVAVTVTTQQFNVPADIAAGDWVNVYNVPTQLYDSTNPVRFRGRYIFPQSIRCYAITWPFEQGYSIYYRDGAGNYTDLTPYIAWEPPGTTLEVGAPMRSLSQ